MKVNDKVKIVQTLYTWDSKLANGLTGKVAMILPNGVIGVLMDNGYKPMDFAFIDGKPVWAFHPDCLEVIG